MSASVGPFMYHPAISFAILRGELEEMESNLAKTHPGINPKSLSTRLWLWMRLVRQFPIQVIIVVCSVWLFVSIVLGFFASILLSIPIVLSFIATWPSWLVVIIPTAVTLAIARLLFLFRSRNRLWYGRIEVLFGIAAAYAASTELVDQIKVVGLISSCYVMVRGFDNWREGATRLECKRLREQVLSKLSELVHVKSEELLRDHLDSIDNKKLLSDYVLNLSSSLKQFKDAGVDAFAIFVERRTELDIATPPTAASNATHR